MIILKNGACTSDPRLDRVRHVDLRSLNYLADISFLGAEPYAKPRSYTWRYGAQLDQGQEGACVGFGWSHELAARPGIVQGLSNDFARRLYWKIQEQDPWL